MSNKEIIQQTAVTLFAEQGYDRTPTSQIAKEAGVSEGLIFRHFGSKAGLLAAIIGAGMAQVAESMQSYAQAGAGGREAIISHIERSFRLVREHETFWRMVQKIRFQTVVQEVAGPQLEEANRFIVSQLTMHFQSIGSSRPVEEALLLFAEIDGVTIHYLQDPARYPLDAMEKLLITKYQEHGNQLD